MANFAFRNSNDELDRFVINEHRDALGRRRLRKDASRKTLDKHLALIDKHAPYGNDPWDPEVQKLDYKND